MKFWIVVDSLSNEPEVFKIREEAINFALGILQDYQGRWHFEQEEYEKACADLKNGDDNSECWGTYIGDREIDIFKKFI